MAGGECRPRSEAPRDLIQETILVIVSIYDKLTYEKVGALGGRPRQFFGLSDITLSF